MTPGLEPAFTPGRPVWPLTGRALADLEPDDPDLAIPYGALQIGIREAPERHFPANRNGLITHMPAEPLGPKPVKTLDLKRKWKFALLASCIFHAAVALFFIRAADEAVLMEGAEFSGIAFLGEGADQVKAGDASETDDPAVEVTMITMLQAKPVETIEAEAVPVEATETATTDVETLEPVKETPAEQVNEMKAEPAQPTERAEPQAAEPQMAPPTAVASETVPEVLATDRVEPVDDDNLVQRPVEPQAAVETVQPEPSQASKATKAESTESAKVETVEITEAEPAETPTVDPVETVKAELTEAKPVEPVEAASPKTEAESAPTPVEKKAASKPEEKTPPAKQAAKPKKAEEGKKVAEKTNAEPKKSGDGGQNQTNARRGQADGQEKGDSRQASRGGSKNGEIGNAAASNYPGKVRSKLARVARSVRAKGRGEVVVAFAVSSNGSVRSARVTRSSGVASVDQAALQAIRKASPFPPIPAGAGRSNWDFSIPLAFMR